MLPAKSSIPIFLTSKTATISYLLLYPALPDPAVVLLTGTFVLSPCGAVAPDRSASGSRITVPAFQQAAGLSLESAYPFLATAHFSAPVPSESAL